MKDEEWKTVGPNHVPMAMEIYKKKSFGEEGLNWLIRLFNLILVLKNAKAKRLSTLIPLLKKLMLTHL